jgi:transcription-repair coupling factor (superfamily II helicase)
VDRVEAGPKGAVIGFYKDSPPNIPALMKWVQGKAGTIKLRPDQKLVAMREWHQAAHRVAGVRGLMRELAGLSQSQ